MYDQNNFITTILIIIHTIQTPRYTQSWFLCRPIKHNWAIQSVGYTHMWDGEDGNQNDDDADDDDDDDDDDAFR